MRHPNPSPWSAIGIFAVAGCFGGSTLQPGGDAGANWEPIVSQTIITTPVQELDILFVIDDTPAVAGVAANLIAQYAVFAQVLQGLPFGAPPLHVAFIPATLPSGDCSPPGIRGATCGLAAQDQFLTADYCDIDQNSSGSLGDAFACLGNFGAQACGTAQSLEAARRALGGDPSGGALRGRTGFVSPGAALDIVFLAGQDDASARNGALVPLSDYVTFFKSLTRDPANMNLASLITPEACPTGGPVAATPTPRLDEITQSFGSNGVIASLCYPSLAPALSNVAQKLGALIRPPCLAGIKDTDPDQPGLQADCVVEDDVLEADGSKRLVSFGVCDPNTPVPPCLSLSPPDAMNDCQAGSWALYLASGPDPVASCGPLGQTVHISCRSCADPADPACAGS